MRLISQNKWTDIPYDLCELSVCGTMGDVCKIMAWVNGATEPNVMGEYSSEDKALKVMEKVRCSYISMIPGSDELSDDNIEKARKMAIDGNVVAYGSSNKVVDGYFRFPADDEVEV